MALEDIEKLKEKVDKDPNSKLFVPLADEYRKMGMLDEAISVLLKGLDNQPGYMSARVSLGKIYLEKNMMAEAKEEFEKVISVIPDNLFAHKKLAEIYRDLGNKERAVGEYKTVLKLNSLDEDAMSNLEMLQSKHIVGETPIESKPIPEELPVPEPVEVEEATEAEEGISVLPAEEALQSATEDEFEEFKKSVTERGEGVEEVIAEEVVSEEEIEEAEKEAISYADIFKEAKTALPAEDVDKGISFETLLKESEPVAEKPLEKEEKPVSNLKEAELFISEGNYSKAMKIYREMLSAEPGNKYVLQKVEELRMLLKMLGKEQDAVIDKLEAFKEGVKKRKDEFLRNP